MQDLGVLMTSNGKFAQHIDHAIRKARKVMGWVLRTFSTRDPEPLLVLYREMVQQYTYSIAVRCRALSHWRVCES